MDAVLGGRYRIVRLLGVGALGSVYEARTAPFDRRCAIKVLHDRFANDDAVVQRFKREARSAASLKHAHIVEVSDFSTDGEKPPFLVMELLTGQSLRELLKRQKRISEERAARIAVQVLSALAVAHDADIIHRDIKPENIFLTTTAASVDMIKVLDFGSAKLLGETDGKPLTVTGMVIGTLSFMPPEQALGRRVDGRADLYALAATIYAAVSGRKPLDAPCPADLLNAVVKHDPAPLASVGVKVDPAFEAILVKALKKNPADRFRSAREMMRAFNRWLDKPRPQAVPEVSILTPGGVSIDATEDSYRRLCVPRAGSSLGRYRLTKALGAGGLGEVFRATDRALRRDVAVKVLRVARDPDETGLPARAAARMLVEARAAATIRHPNVVEVFDAHYSAPGIAYLVMELVPGRTLRHFIGDPYVPIERKIGWLIDVARALSAAHTRGVVHQDIKPENVMVRDDGVIKVLDFGIARRIFENDSSLPGTETVERIPGTPVYMAPEQMRGSMGSELTDQFTWAVLAYELLTGSLPWLQHGGVLHVVHEILTRTPEAPSRRRSDVPREIDGVVLKAMAKRPEDRYASMDAVIVALTTAWAEAASRPIDEIVVRRPPRRGLIAAAVAAMTLLGGAMSPHDGRATRPLTAAATELGPPDFGSTMSPNEAAAAAYAAGIDAVRRAAGGAARTSFDRAIELDPSFAAAHLRKVLATPEVTDAERENALKATQLRDALGAHDRALLHAIAPWVSVPQDALEVERRLVELTATHKDPDYLYQLCRFRVLDGNYAGAIEACRAAREIDGGFAGAYWLEGQSLLFLGETAAGSAALDTCLRVAPTATSCLNDVFNLRSHDGACDAALGDARRLVDLEPGNARWLQQLGMVSYAMDRPIADARTALERSWDVTPAQRAPFIRTWTRANLAVLTGDFDEARSHLVALERVVDGNADEFSHRMALRLRALFQREVGQEAALAGRARAFLAKRQAWSPSPDEDGAIDALVALYRAGGLTRREFVADRETWLAQERSRPRPAGRFGMGPGRQWINAYANAVLTKDDASDALAVLSDYLPLPPDRFRDTDDDEAIGRTYLLAGRNEEALPFLRRAARSCEAARYPFQHTWANLELGQALESTDSGAACAAYRVVFDRWATASRSESARVADARRKALSCR